ncbi:ClpP/crotonase [Trichoderma citrinoviride]|uniref:ClpP/crotonase n=1 Tax=Trichoderma citrinoviride TaxID=58853 RepID=A0A2T4B234_9HYPO|nr:ClpP/crotonase [Trichoderma citrinoviride]PTB63382.1 ClpP/crotonase [Trichoderma citrinoviride]
MPYVPEQWSFDDVVKLTKISPAYWRATFNAPPLNLFTPRTYKALRVLIEMLENDRAVKVIVFDSASEEYFIAHYDLLASEGKTEGEETSVVSDWANFALRLARVPVVSIAQVAGRVRGHGSEFILACDMRFGSIEKAIFAQPEAGAGVHCGGGGIEWLPRLVNRSRALEILLGGDDIDAVTAAQYGYINRAIKDAELSSFVDNFARRIAGFDRKPLLETKRAVNDRAGLPRLTDLLASMQDFVRATKWPETERRVKTLFEMGLQQDGPGERDLGRLLHEASVRMYGNEEDK